MQRIFILFSLLFFTTIAVAQQLDSTNLPIIILNTHGQPIPDDPKIMADMGIIWNPNTMNHVTDPFNHYNGKIGIEIRGQSSQMFPMKAYSIELWDNSGNSINSSLFGLPPESDWILYAPYNEKTLTHNFLAYSLSREMGHWAANCRYVEVILNGQYIGIYVFMEKIKRDAGRVAITSIDTSHNSGNSLTGGYIFSIDKAANGWYSVYPAPASSYPIQFNYVYPDLGDITIFQRNYIESNVDSFENALHAVNFQDTTLGWRKFADENSFIDFFLMNELSRNVDGYRISTYFHKDRYSVGGKIKAGPVWDFDIAFGNANYCEGGDTTGWAYRFNFVCPTDPHAVNDWWSRFLTDTLYKSRLRCRWNVLRATTFSTSHLYSMIDSVALLTTAARVRHFQKWPVLGQYVWPNPWPVPATYAGEIQALKSWLASRLRWLDNNIPVTGTCSSALPVIDIDGMTSLQIDIFPNPVTEESNIRIRSAHAQDLTLIILDISGRTISQANLRLSSGSNSASIPSTIWASGIYFFEFTATNGDRIVKRIVKQ